MSIRARLFTVLLLMTGLVWLSACVWIYTSTKARLEHVLDARLVESARMVGSLVGDRPVDIRLIDGHSPTHDEDADADAAAIPSYERQLACQIWSISGRLLSKSDSAPDASLSDHASGFQNTVINGIEWRVYAVVKPDLGVRVLVGDSVEVRDRLVDDVIKGLLYPALFIMPLMAGLIWLCVSRGLAPLQKLANGMKARDATELHGFADKGTPSELRPMIHALNSLLARVQATREREREFTTYAAHELKTPLAGLKTQAQVAMRSTDPEVQQQALRRIEQSVDRTSRMAKQLIDLAAVDATEAQATKAGVDIPRLILDVIQELEPLRRARAVEITCRLSEEADTILIEADRSLLRLAIRNVMENAVQHSPKGSTVECRAELANGKVNVVVIDEGAGIAVEEQERVLQRFYRSPRSEPGGSGLGLAIVKMAIDRLGGRLQFSQFGQRFAVSLEL
ncbi:ATP-binding protein [Rhizobium rhizogenes]|uniref:ATP-binding protein n=1 Tax=Rhizobium rhizogenes TaxID=359 RepID=UPI0022CA9B63|nr:ATP-binding protein [Rhizobium rhizogenes]MCZ7466221.1 ATP-binding protein [Rhizobium rhizogenes]